MKKQLSSIAIVALLISFTSCKSSSDTANTSAKSEQSEKRGQPRQRGERPDAATILGEMDANKNGKLSKDEVKGPLQQNFSKIDSNEDNFISKEELENAPKPERSGGQNGRPQRRN